jgi:hypothetical protein
MYFYPTFPALQLILIQVLSFLRQIKQIGSTYPGIVSARDSCSCDSLFNKLSKMKTSICFLLVAIAVFAVRASEIKKDRGVLVLEKGNFQDAITQNKHILVEFCKYHFLCF